MLKEDRLHASGVAVPVLLGMCALAVSLSLYEAGWGPGLIMLPLLVSGSLALALLLVHSELPPLLLHLCSLVVGIMVTILATGHYVLAGISSAQAAHMVLQRMVAWALASWQGQPSEDLLPFTFLLGLSLWLAFYYSAWLIYRAGRVWWAVVAPAIALLANTYYAPQSSAAYIVIYGFCGLLLVARVSVQGLMRDWRLAHIPHDHTIGDDFLIDALYVVLAVLVASWLLPPLTLEQSAARLWVRFEGPWRQVQRRWTQMFPTLSTSSHSDQATSLFGDSLILGGPVRLPADPLFEVRMPSPSRMQSMVYDLYDGRQWWSSAASIALLEPRDYPQVEPFAQRRPVQQTVTVMVSTRALLAVPLPRAYSLPVKSEQVAFRLDKDTPALDIYAATSRRALYPGDSYEVTSAVSIATEDMLRQAGEEYPSWLPHVYMEVPASVPARVGELARRIAAGAGNPYDKAVAIQDYLRSLSYTLNVSAPPTGRDAVDYFLFDSRQGYCSYFASAMVLMARSVGIPARMAAGYAAPAYDARTGAYIITGANAHAWPQLYFPGYGWIDFEPTPAQALIERPSEQSLPAMVNPAPAAPVQPQTHDVEPQVQPGMARPGGLSVMIGRWPWLRLLLLLAVLLGGLASTALVVWLERRNWTPAERAFANLVAVALLLGVRPRRSETPAEYGSRVCSSLPEAAADAHLIVQEFIRVRYGGWRNESQAASASAAAWARLARTALKALPRRLIQPVRPVT